MYLTSRSNQITNNEGQTTEFETTEFETTGFETEGNLNDEHNETNKTINAPAPQQIAAQTNQSSLEHDNCLQAYLQAYLQRYWAVEIISFPSRFCHNCGVWICLTLFVFALIIGGCFWMSDGVANSKEFTKENCFAIGKKSFNCLYDCQCEHNGNNCSTCNGQKYSLLAIVETKCGNNTVFESDKKTACNETLESLNYTIPHYYSCYASSCDKQKFTFDDPTHGIIGGIVLILIAILFCCFFCGAKHLFAHVDFKIFNW